MNKYFVISYRKEYSEEATINQNCKDELLGLGLKDICLYLKEMKRDVFPEYSSSNGELHILWTYDPLKYTQLSANEFIRDLQEVKDNLTLSTDIEKQMRIHDFILTDIVQEIDTIILYAEENGTSATIEKYRKRLNFILGTLGKNEIIWNDISIRPFSLSFTDTQKILQKIYDHIPLKTKEKFPFQINFMDLTYIAN
ncbi:hypothetical protein [Coprobacter sp.]